MSSTDLSINVEEMVNVIESHVELRVKSVEEMVNVIESHVELRVKSVEEIVNVIESHAITVTTSSTDFTLSST
jgi:hypothetical protein